MQKSFEDRIGKYESQITAMIQKVPERINQVAE
jgi:hypothetical protein